MIKAVIFDADGVVIRSKMFSNSLERAFGISNKEMLPFFQNEFKDCLVGDADLKEKIQPYLKQWG